MVNVLFADGFEEVEALAVVDMLRRAEIETKIISADNKDFITGAHGIKICSDCGIKNAVISDMIVLPGGVPGVPNLGANENVLDFIKKHYDLGKYIAAICAAPSLLAKLSIIDNKNVTCYPSYADKLGNGVFTNESVSVDGNIITSKACGTVFEFAFKIIEILKGREISEKIRNSVYYR